MSAQTIPPVICALHQRAMWSHARGPNDYFCEQCIQQLQAADKLAEAIKAQSEYHIGQRVAEALATYEKARGK